MIELVCGAPVALPMHKSQLEIEVRYMHGDGDAYTSESFFFDFGFVGLPKRFVEMIEALKFIRSHEFPKYEGSRAQTKALEAKFGEDYEEDLLIHDTTDSGYDNNANIEGYKLFVYDASGQKFHASVQGEQNV